LQQREDSLASKEAALQEEQKEQAEREQALQQREAALQAEQKEMQKERFYRYISESQLKSPPWAAVALTKQCLEGKVAQGARFEDHEAELRAQMDAVQQEKLQLEEDCARLYLQHRHTMGYLESCGHSPHKIMDQQCTRTSVVQELADLRRPRLALCIGNADYEGSNALHNPANDANDLTEKLESEGFNFRADAAVNLDQTEMLKAIRAFKDRVRDAVMQMGDGGGVVALFAFSGHGCEVDGEEYLVPLNTDVGNDPDEAKARYYRLQTVADQLTRCNPNGVNIVIVDACRSTMTRAIDSPNLPSGKGLIVWYSAHSGCGAYDGAPGRNGVFTEAMLNQLCHDPKLTHTSMFSAIKHRVCCATDGKQVPIAKDDFVGSKVGFVFYISERTRKALKALQRCAVQDELNWSTWWRGLEERRQKAKKAAVAVRGSGGSRRWAGGPIAGP
jgi:hypothetical protein